MTSDRLANMQGAGSHDSRETYDAMTLSKFSSVITAEFADDQTLPAPDDGLAEVWGLDSFDFVRMMLFIEDLAVVVDPPDDFPDLQTLRSAFRYYRACILQDPGTGPRTAV